MKTKLFTLLLAVAASVGTLFAASGTCGTNVTWDLTSGVLTISGTGAMTSWTRSTDVPWYSHRATIKSVVLEEGVTRVGSLAFSGYTNMTSISLPSTLTLIDSYSLYGCSGLTSLTLPASVATIEESAFNGCTGLKSITCEAVNPPAYGEDCFENVNKSIPLYVPTESVAKYKADADWGQFTNIQPMKCLPASGTCGAYEDNLTWELDCDGVLTISGTGEMADYLFEDPSWQPYISSIKTVVIEDGVTSIGVYAFYNCTGLTSVTIPNSVTSIGDGAFYDCSSLTTVTIPNSVTSIGYWAFEGCTGLTSITCEAITPPTCGEYCFMDVDKTIPVYVPKGTVEAYRAANEWKDFTNIQEATGPIDPTGKTAYELVDLSKESVTAGEYIIVFDDNKAHAAVSGKDLIASSDELTFEDDYAFVPEEAVCAVTIAPLGTDSFSILLANGTSYLDLQAKNSVTTAATPAGFAITAGDDKTAQIAKYLPSESKTYVLKRNGNYFRMYNGTTYTLPKLYRKKADAPTGMDNIQDTDVQNIKVLRDGQIYILRGEKVYTLTGQEVR